MTRSVAVLLVSAALVAPGWDVSVHLPATVAGPGCVDGCCDCGFPKGRGCFITFPDESYDPASCVVGPCFECDRSPMDYFVDAIDAEELATLVENTDLSLLGSVVTSFSEHLAFSSSRRLLVIGDASCGPHTPKVAIRLPEDRAKVLEELTVRSLQEYLTDTERKP